MLRRKSVHDSELGDPTSRRPSVVNRSREWILGRQAVIYVEDREPGIGGKVTADRIEAVAIAHKPAAPMERNNSAWRTEWLIDAGGEVATRARNGKIQN